MNRTAFVIAILLFLLGVAGGLLRQSDRCAECERHLHGCELAELGQAEIFKALDSCETSLWASNKAFCLAGCDIPGPVDDAWCLENADRPPPPPHTEDEP